MRMIHLRQPQNEGLLGHAAPEPHPDLRQPLADLAAAFERARKRPLLPAPQLPMAHDRARTIALGIPLGKALAYLREVAIPAFEEVADATPQMLNRQIQDLSVELVDPHAQYKAAIADLSHQAALRAAEDRMSQARTFFHHITARGISIQPDGTGALTVRPAALLSEEERKTLSNVKHELLLLLSSAEAF